MSRISEHVNIEQLGDITTSPRVVLGPERVSYDGTLLVNNCAFFGRRPCRPDLPDQVAKTLRRRREFDAELVECAHYCVLECLQYRHSFLFLCVSNCYFFFFTLYLSIYVTNMYRIIITISISILINNKQQNNTFLLFFTLFFCY